MRLNIYNKQKNNPVKTCNYYTLHLFISLSLLLVAYTATAQITKKQVNKTTDKNQSAYQLTYKIIPAEQGTYGYEIYDHNRKMIYQPSIPGIPGNNGFKKKNDAEKVAKLVMYKINHNQMPPTVTQKEMQKLMVKF